MRAARSRIYVLLVKKEAEILQIATNDSTRLISTILLPPSMITLHVYLVRWLRISPENPENPENPKELKVPKVPASADLSHMPMWDFWNFSQSDYVGSLGNFRDFGRIAGLDVSSSPLL